MAHYSGDQLTIEESQATRLSQPIEKQGAQGTVTTSAKMTARDVNTRIWAVLKAVTQSAITRDIAKAYQMMTPTSTFRLLIVLA